MTTAATSPKLSSMTNADNFVTVDLKFGRIYGRIEAVNTGIFSVLTNVYEWMCWDWDMCESERSLPWPVVTRCHWCQISMRNHESLVRWPVTNVAVKQLETTLLYYSSRVTLSHWSYNWGQDTLGHPGTNTPLQWTDNFSRHSETDRHSPVSERNIFRKSPPL